MSAAATDGQSIDLSEKGCFHVTMMNEPPDSSRPLAHFYRYLWEEPNLVTVLGDISPILDGRRHYHTEHGLALGDDARISLLGAMFAGAVLAAVSLPEPESWGWSVALPGQRLGVFCAVESMGMVCGRILPTEPHQRAVVVQRARSGESITHSHFTLDRDDPLRAVELFFVEAEQTLVRLAVDPAGRCLLLRPLPNGSFDPISGMSDQEILDHCRSLAESGKLERLSEMLLYYECRCNDEMILNLILNLPPDQRLEIWGDGRELEVECPRCGRQYRIRRHDL
jgi:hypothetical protein